ncbi:MAG: DUF4142 domain-containing protein [Betaproteobacteria bacterium]|jgi:putative membrane protein
MLVLRCNKVAIAVALAGAAIAWDANAATPATPPAARPSASASSQSLSTDDRQFAMKAAEAGMAEVELGKLAQQKAQNDQVKQFGERMVRDHSQANDRLKQVVASKNVTLPAHLDKSGQKDLDQLTKLSGPKFDQQYIKKQVSGHEKVIQEFRKEAKSGRDQDLRTFASRTLPTLEQHLTLAKSAQKAAEDEASQSASSDSGLKAAKKATGASHVAAEKQEHMPVPKTGM